MAGIPGKQTKHKQQTPPMNHFIEQLGTSFALQEKAAPVLKDYALRVGYRESGKMLFLEQLGSETFWVYKVCTTTRSKFGHYDHGLERKKFFFAGGWSDHDWQTVSAADIDWNRVVSICPIDDDNASITIAHWPSALIFEVLSSYLVLAVPKETPRALVEFLRRKHPRSDIAANHPGIGRPRAESALFKNAIISMS